MELRMRTKDREALFNGSMKHMLAYSSIGQIGYVIIGDSNDAVGYVSDNHIFLQIIHGLIDRVMEVIGAPFVQPGHKAGYHIEHANDTEFLQGRQASIIYKGKRLGAFGVVRPEVLNNFAVPDPCSFVEIDIENFL